MQSNNYVFHRRLASDSKQTAVAAKAEELLAVNCVHVVPQEYSTCFRQFLEECLLKRIEDGNTSRVTLVGAELQSMHQLIVEASTFFIHLMEADPSYSISYKKSEKEWIILTSDLMPNIEEDNTSYMFKINRDDAFKNSVQEFMLLNYKSLSSSHIANELKRCDFNLILLDIIPQESLVEDLKTLHKAFKQSQKSRSSKQIQLPPKLASIPKFSAPVSPKSSQQAKKTPKHGIRSSKSGTLAVGQFKSTSPKRRLPMSGKTVSLAGQSSGLLRTLENVISHYASPERKKKVDNTSGSIETFQADLTGPKKETDSLNYSPRTISNSSPFYQGRSALGSPFGQSPKNQRTKINPVLSKLLATRDSLNNAVKQKTVDSKPDDIRDSWRQLGKDKRPSLIDCKQIDSDDGNEKLREIEKLKAEVKAKDTVCEEYKTTNAKVISEMNELKREFQKVLHELQKPNRTALSPSNSLSKLKHLHLNSSFGTPQSNNTAKVASPNKNKAMLLFESRRPSTPSPDKHKTVDDRNDYKIQYLVDRFANESVDDNRSNGQLVDHHRLISPIRHRDAENGKHRRSIIDSNAEKVVNCHADHSLSVSHAQRPAPPARPGAS